MNVMVMNFTNEGWSLEFEGAIMNQALLNTSKKPPKWYNIVHYCRKGFFAGLVDKGKDNAETVLAGFVKFATV
jgi:N-succinyl-L-ornithine transcarbamylase